MLTKKLNLLYHHSTKHWKNKLKKEKNTDQQGANTFSWPKK